MIPDTNSEQMARWNGPAARGWVEAQQLLDQVFKPLEALLVRVVSEHSGSAVLDVGCGTGSTTLAAARWLGPGARCVGIDISEPMVVAARARAEADHVAAQFIRADAQVHPFEPRSVDAVISRFGVMFFDDPVRAFANLRGAVRDGGALRFIAWRSAAENAFMTTAERAAAPLLPNLPPRRPDAPGQFAFGDRDRVQAILSQSGWTAIDIQPLDVLCTLPESSLVDYLTRLGPVGTALQEVDEATRAQVIAAVRPAFDPYVQGDSVRFNAACWIANAQAGRDR